MERILIFDTTLRDGEQTPGVSFHLAEKVEIAKALEALGVDVIEAGFAGASPGDLKAIQAVAQVAENMRVCSLARCVEGDILAAANTCGKLWKKIFCLIKLFSEIIRNDAMLANPVYC